MRPIRKHLFTVAVAIALLLPLSGLASADPTDAGFFDPTIVTPVQVVQISAPGAVTITRTAPTTATVLDPSDGGFH